MGPGPRFEPESQDPQSRRMTAYPTPAYEYPNRIKTKNKRLCGSRDSNPGRSASTGPKPVSFGRSDTPATKRGKEIPKKSFKYKKMLRPGFEPESSARKAEMIGRTTPSEQKHMKIKLDYAMGPMGFEPMTSRL